MTTDLLHRIHDIAALTNKDPDRESVYSYFIGALSTYVTDEQWISCLKTVEKIVLPEK